MELFPAILYSQPVRGVDNPYQGVCLLKIIAPV
jgi:hypothetical protein